MNGHNNILIVDDTVKNLQILCEILSEEDDYRVNVARNGKEAIEMVSRVEFDLILLDIQMPIMDGYEACRRLKADKKSADIPIIFLTAQVDKESIVRGFEAGAVDYLTKPFNNTELKSRIKTQIDLKKHRDNLETLVDQRTSQLNDALEKVNVDIKAKEHFLANMSHEIRTPLNGVMGMASLLDKTYLDEEQQHYLSTLVNSAKYLQTIVDDIFDYTLLNTGSLEIEKVNFSPKDEILRCTDLFRYRCEEKGLTFDTNFSEKLPMNLQADFKKINRIVSLLLSNGLKFTEKGGISVFVSYNFEHSELIIKVTDTGIGIKLDDKEKIFEKFQQLDSSTQRSFGGTGIGLALCRELLKLLKGKIDVESDLNSGSTFTIAVKAEEVNLDTVEIQVFNKVKGTNILLVEDDKTNQDVTVRILKPLGLEIDVADNGAIALNMLQEKNYNLVLMDIMMPVMNGYDATKAIRANKKWDNLPIVALTACLLRDAEEECKRCGMNDFLEKPIDVDKLINVVNQFIVCQ
ncbi:MAG: response regulator [Lentisphaeraceae bacterium]|nr:response regulator [Lentisphaeraceae bacterium]